MDGQWSCQQRKKETCTVDKELASVISDYLLSLGWIEDYSFHGFTEVSMMLEDRNTQFRISQSYHGRPWRDWCIIDKVDPMSNHDRVQHAGKILGFITFPTTVRVINSMGLYVVAQLSSEEVSLQEMKKKFIKKITTSNNYENFVVLPLSRIVAPLGVFENYGGEDNESFATLPYRHWCEYFNRRIKT